MFENIECLVNKEGVLMNLYSPNRALKSTTDLALATRYYVLLS